MKKIKEKIGLIGVGNMGTSILEGLLRKKMISPSNIWVYDKIQEKADDFAQRWKVKKALSNEALAGSVDLVLLAVKPQDLKTTADEMRNLRGHFPAVLSILAGTPIEKLQSHFGRDAKIVRSMPNLGAKVGESLTAIAGTEAKPLALAEQIFSACGKVLQLEEKYFDLVTAISGSGPAYFFYVMELLTKEGVRGGLSEEKAKLLAVQTALGAALLASQAAESPEELRKQVTSKGGTTEAALKIFEVQGLPKAFREAVEAARKRGQELSQSL